MGNISIAIKRFIGNKNTVTILGVLAGIVVLFLGYTWRVNTAVEPQSVPFAKEELKSNTLITNDLVGSIKISKNVVNATETLVTSSNQVIGKYVSYDTTIPKGSFFYKNQLRTEEQMPNYIIKDIADGYTVYALPVDMDLTYANSIMPDDYIDLYFTAVDDNRLVMFGKLIESIKVIAVRDSRGKSVFSSESTSGIPSKLIFAVPDEMFRLLKKADYITSNSIRIIPVPRNAAYTANPGETQVTSKDIENFILSKSAYITEEITANINTETETETETE